MHPTNDFPCLSQHPLYSRSLSGISGYCTHLYHIHLARTCLNQILYNSVQYSNRKKKPEQDCKSKSGHQLLCHFYHRGQHTSDHRHAHLADRKHRLLPDSGKFLLLHTLRWNHKADRIQPDFQLSYEHKTLLTFPEGK